MIDLPLAEFGIRQLHGRYIDATWRRDPAAFGACFTEDAHWHIAGFHFAGRPEIEAGFERLMVPSKRVLMFIGTPVLEIGEGGAAGRVYVTEYQKRRDDTAGRTLGCYDDHYVGEGQHWRFRSRRWHLLYRGPADFSDPFLDGPDAGPPSLLSGKS
jgi:hypothetical protein